MASPPTTTMSCLSLKKLMALEQARLHDFRAENLVKSCREDKSPRVIEVTCVILGT